MTNRIAVFLALLVVGGILADFTLDGGAGLMFLARKGDALIDYIAIWR